MPPPPPPFHILRTHSAPISVLSFTPNHLLAGDQDGVVSVTSLATRRTIASWHAHEGGVLGVQEWDRQLVTCVQGRDNTIKFYGIPTDATGPPLHSSMPSNSLNFCRMSIAQTAEGGLLAVPNLTDAEYVDIYSLPSQKRIGAAVNFVRLPPKPEGSENRSGLVMGIHIAVLQGRYTLVVGYEDGRVEIWQPASQDEGEEWNGKKGTGWERRWEGKPHNEAVMAMVVDNGCTAAFTVSADHVVVRIDIGKALRGDAEPMKKYSTKNIGNAALAVSADGKLLAVGGWDGKTRLYSAATLKPLGTLAYHRESVQALAFGTEDREDESVLELGEDSDSEDDDGPRGGWLASGGKDRRIALWSIKIGGMNA